MYTWPDAAPDLTLPAAGTVGCWRVPLTLGIMYASALDILNTPERARLERFRALADQERYLAAHAGLRIILGAALRCDPAGLAFRHGPHGKPELPDAHVHFNVSHSGDMVLVALSSECALGVDVEEIRVLPERRAIVGRYFHPGEVADLASLDDDAAAEAFYRAWTRKEALSKALGLGLTLEPNQFRVSCRPDEAAAVRELHGFATAPSDWSLVDLEPGAGYAAAVAIPQRTITVTRRTLHVEQ